MEEPEERPGENRGEKPGKAERRLSGRAGEGRERTGEKNPGRLREDRRGSNESG